MDKKSLTGLLIIGVILFAFSWYNSKRQQKFAPTVTVAEVQEAIRTSGFDETAALRPDSASAAGAEQALRQHIGNMLYDASHGDETFYTVENDRSEERRVGKECM